MPKRREHEEEEKRKRLHKFNKELKKEIKEEKREDEFNKALRKERREELKEDNAALAATGAGVVLVEFAKRDGTVVSFHARSKAEKKAYKDIEKKHKKRDGGK